MRSSLRNRLLLAFVALMIVVGSVTLVAIERSLARDLLLGLDERLTKQATSVSEEIRNAGHPERLATRLARVTGTRLTIVGANGLIQGDSDEAATEGQPIGEAEEIAKARRGAVGRAIRRLRAGEPPLYLVAVPADQGRVVRLAVPLDNVIETRSRMRYRLLVAGGFGFLGSLLLAWFFIRALTKPLQAMTQVAEKLAAGDFDVAPAVDASGELGVLSRAMTRMTAEVKARVDELTQQRDLLSVVVGGLVEGVVVVDRAGKSVLANDAAKPLLTAGAVPVALAALVERALRGEPADEELELSGRAVRASARPLGSAEAGAIIVLYDVTRMRSLEAVRREFLSNAAHELRTPVTSIAGYAETLLANPVDAETSREFLETIHRNADRIAGLVNDLVLLDTLGGRASVVGDRLPIALAEVARNAARTAKGVTPTAQITVDVPADVAVLGTREGLDHVVQNLIDNAVKYGGNTPVAVAAEPVAGSRVRLTVRDHGPGIPPEQAERIFERFYRIDPGRSRDKGGSGLGLAIVKSQVEAMGGRVFVEAAEPGARFVVELDAAATTSPA